MVDITNANIEKMYELNGLHEVVVQKGNVGKTYNYALQLLKQGTDAVVYRARHGRDFVKGKGKNSNVERLYLDGIHSVLKYFLIDNYVVILKLGNMLIGQILIVEQVNGLSVLSLKKILIILQFIGILKLLE